jgi:4-amino-4-deoxy-L-arabinose transferase-like glycosyltransferase
MYRSPAREPRPPTAYVQFPDTPGKPAPRRTNNGVTILSKRERLMVPNWLRSTEFPLPAFCLIVVINAAMFAIFPQVGGAVGAETGTDGYKEIAENLVQGRGFIFAAGMRSAGMVGYMKREPIYPLFLAGILRITGTLNPLVLCIFQTALCLFSCWLIYRVGRYIFDSATATVAAYLYALHPVSFWYSGRFASEMVAVPISLLTLLAAVKFLDSPSGATAGRIGLMVGVAALAKSAYAVALPLVLVFALIRERAHVRRIVPLIGLAIICYAGVHSLWLLRNYRLAGEIVPFTTMNGFSFFVGNKIFDEFDRTKQTAGFEPDQSADVLYRSVQAEIETANPGLSMPQLEARTDARLIEMARRLAVASPWYVIKKVSAGAIWIWYLSDTTAKSFGWMVFQLPLLLLAIVSLYREDQWTLSKAFLVTFALAYVLSYAAVSPLARYGMVIIPVVMLFASHGLANWLKSNLYTRHLTSQWVPSTS